MYEELEQIGEGAFGRVAKIRRVEDGKILVWKEIYFGSMTEKEKQMLVDEVNLMREFVDHENIVRYYDRVIDRENKRIYIVMEYCSGGDLAAAIKRQKQERCYFEESFLWDVLRQVASAVEMCHQRQGGIILHRDLKPNNILLDETRTVVKLGDFGLAKILNDRTKFAWSHVGTPTYMSPEQVRETKYGMKSDIWSLGCLMYEMARLLPPFRAKNQLALAKKITTGLFEPLPGHFSPELINLIVSMLDIRPRNRPTVSEVLRICERNMVGELGGIEGEQVDECAAFLSREISLRRREKELAARVRLLAQREEEMAVRERQLVQDEQEIAKLRRSLNRRERQLDEREQRLREKQIERETSPRQILSKEFVTPKTLRSLPRVASPILGETRTPLPRFDKDAVLARLNSARRLQGLSLQQPQHMGEPRRAHRAPLARA